MSASTACLPRSRSCGARRLSIVFRSWLRGMTVRSVAALYELRVDCVVVGDVRRLRRFIKRQALGNAADVELLCVLTASHSFSPRTSCRLSVARRPGDFQGQRLDVLSSRRTRQNRSPMQLRISSAAAALRDVMRNPSIRRIELGWAIGTAADWAFLVILLVFAYDAGGTLAVGILGAVRTVPAMVAAPFASTLVHRYRGDRVLTAINVVRCAGAVLAAIAIGADMPIGLVFVLAALVAGAGSLVRPIQSALLPAFAQTPRELVAANVASSTGEGLGTFVGPLLAGLVVAGTGSVAASLLVAVTFAGAAAAVTGIRFERAADARGGGEEQAARLRLADALRVLRRYPGATLVAGDFVVQTFVRGLLVTLIVVSAIEVLSMGDSGIGLLNAAIGFGGLVGALGALGLR